MQKIVHVAAAALCDAQGRIMLAQRPEGKPMAGLWEFPGGKLEPGEAPETALVRELREELGIEVAIADLEPLQFVSHIYEKFHLVMLLYGLRRWEGALTMREGQQIAWLYLGEFAEYDLAGALLPRAEYPLPAADIPLLPALKSWSASLAKHLA